jgi:hypothetical protein
MRIIGFLQGFLRIFELFPSSEIAFSHTKIAVSPALADWIKKRNRRAIREASPEWKWSRTW